MNFTLNQRAMYTKIWGKKLQKKKSSPKAHPKQKSPHKFNCPLINPKSKTNQIFKIGFLEQI